MVFVHNHTDYDHAAESRVVKVLGDWTADDNSSIENYYLVNSRMILQFNRLSFAIIVGHAALLQWVRCGLKAGLLSAFSVKSLFQILSFPLKDVVRPEWSLNSATASFLSNTNGRPKYTQSQLHLPLLVEELTSPCPGQTAGRNKST